MQQLVYKVPTFSTPEKFFTENLIELLHRLTIDTYRARAMNPKSILEELRTLLADKRIVNPKQYEYAIIEARILLQDENELNFGSISKNHFIGLISKLQKSADKKPRENVLLAIDSLILEYNKDYDKKLLDIIEEHLAAFNACDSGDAKYVYFEKLRRYISFFITELISARFSKLFLYRFVSDHFAGSKAVTFASGMKDFKSLLLKHKKKFQIIFKLEIAPGIVSAINLIDAAKSWLTEDIAQIVNTVSAAVPNNKKTKLNAFAGKTFRSPHFLHISVEAFDAFSALEMARISLSENLDLIHLGYSNEEVFPEKSVLIIEETAPEMYYYQFRNLRYELDGNFKNGDDLYKQFSLCFSRIELDSRIKVESKEKLKSAIRYLRLGNEAIEVEHKFLNYWIAVEYLFSDIEDHSDINNIKRYFSCIHTNIYLNRLLNDFHFNIYRLRKHKIVPGFDYHNLTYLKTVATYEYIMENFAEDSPLLAHRAAELKRILFPDVTPDVSKAQSDLEKLLNRHTTNLELNLSRMYRIRNTIIHNAAINMDILSTVGNLKYYLNFILCYAITELTENTSMKCIKDLFDTQEIIFNSLMDEKFPKEKLMSIKTHFDLIV